MIECVALWGRVCLGEPGEHAAELLGLLQEVEVAALEVDDLFEGAIVRHDVLLGCGRHRVVFRVSNVHRRHCVMVLFRVCNRRCQHSAWIGPHQLRPQHPDLGIQAVVKDVVQFGGGIIERRGRILRPVSVAIMYRIVDRYLQLISHNDVGHDVKMMSIHSITRRVNLHRNYECTLQ